MRSQPHAIWPNAALQAPRLPQAGRTVRETLSGFAVALVTLSALAHSPRLLAAPPAMAATTAPSPSATATPTAGAPLSENIDAAALATEYVQMTEDQLRLEATAEHTRQLCNRLEQAKANGALAHNVCLDLSAMRDDIRESLTRMLQETNAPVLEHLSQSILDLQRDQQRLRTAWTEVRTDLNEKRLQLFQVQAAQQVAGRAAFLMNVDNRWFWMGGFVAFASLVVVAAHERRREIRRRLNGGRARSMGLSRVLIGVLLLFFAITVATFWKGEQLFQWLLVAGTGEKSSPRQEIESQNQQARNALEKSQRERTELQAKSQPLLQWARAEVEKSQPQGAALAAQWTDAIRRCQAIQVGLKVQAGMSEQLAADLQQLDALQQNVTLTVGQKVTYGRMRRGICGALGLSLLGLAVLGGTAFKRGVKRRLQKTRNTCPLCLGDGKGEGTFIPMDATLIGSSNYRLLQCTHVIDEELGEHCDFTFAEAYQDIFKLCFPTLGIPQAGKTLWLAMVYRQLNKGNSPDGVTFEKVKSTKSEFFDQVVEDVVQNKINPEATQEPARIPWPLIFNFEDRDPLGKSQVLLSVFDYSGEVLERQTLESRARQRALDADGYLFFLDPTYPSEKQAEALARFREDLKIIKGIKPGKKLHTPVALCVSKLDLMAGESYGDLEGGGIVGLFYRDLQQIGWKSDLDSMAKRSRLVAELRDTIWPGWNIEKQIDSLFGGRHMFFPLTPVGLDKVDQPDISRRNLEPLGLLDPLLWLLHMNGYPVLK